LTSPHATQGGHRGEAELPPGIGPVRSGVRPLESADAGEIFRAYRPAPHVRDEMAAADGSVRPHWRRFAEVIGGLPPRELARRWRLAGRLLHENGLTYTLDPAAGDRPWELDFVPMVIDTREWRDIEAGLVQRARLLNAVLADLYGPQRLLKEGRLPAGIVFGNPHFLRPCHGIRPRDGVFLHFYAADLGRGVDGRWRVLGDRTQAPSGLGYALENRIVLSRCLPELFRTCQVHRLAGYFQEAHDSLVARTARENPRIALLTPGPGVEGYFAHAYLARYLGYTLAEGGDLTVRDNRVYLKSVDGLKLVDLIMRRVDADDCDPLELRVESHLGVAGMLQAARAGTVTVANALGSGLVETKALMPFLPDLCRHLFGEDLLIPSSPTWWCGRDEDRAEVFERLGELVIDGAFMRRTLLSTVEGIVIGRDLSADERARLMQRLTVRGHGYVAQEVMTLSTTPVWVDGRLEPRSMSVRAFLAAKDDTYVVMPGGLTRVAASRDAHAIALHRGQGTKDTWVLSDEPVGSVTLLGSPLSYARPKRTGKDLPSRAADNLFWLGRYAERTEDLVRALRGVVSRLTEDAGPMSDFSALRSLLRVLLEKSEVQMQSADWRAPGPAALLERKLATLMFDPACAYGLQESLEHLHRTASLVRDRLSLDAWRTLSRLHAHATGRADIGEAASARIDFGAALDLLDDAVRSLSAFSGMEMENMTRNHGWRFLDMGRRLERAQHLAEILRSLLARGDPEADGSLVLILELADSMMTYRSRYLTTPMVPPVIDLLVLDDTNPRSIAFQMRVLADHVDQLPRDAELHARTPQQREMLALVTDIQLADIAELCHEDADGRRSALDRLLFRIATAMPRLSEMIGRDYFSHAEARRPADF
jgi:uncharacterized circularly permuted ATP-grasp superfamily protein/uncharacterized alpha-E superfamily protein